MSDSFQEIPLKTIPYMDYRNREGKVLKGLPADPYHMQRYLARGFKPIQKEEKNNVIP